MTKYLCYGGPYHNRTVDLPPGSYMMNVSKMPERNFRSHEEFPVSLMPHVVTYSLREIGLGDERARVLLAPRKKDYDCKKVWNTLYRRGYVKTPAVL